MRKSWFIFLVAVLGCHNSSDSGFLAETVSTRPAAIAGDDFDVAVNAAGVTLDGSKSVDYGGGTLSFQWTQTAGPAVALSNAAVASPTFTAPADPATLTFRLTVTGAEGTDTDTVNVFVKNVVVNVASDPLFVGYGLTSATNVAASASGTATPFAYEWSGFAPWMDVSNVSSATLSINTTPLLTDFKKLADTAGVAVLENSAQGRVQLKVKVTDANGDWDEDWVEFSVGPFPSATAHENVALGEAVFLNGGGGTTTAWTWSGTKPNGAAMAPADFRKPNKTSLSGATDQRVVYFVPDQLGLYRITVVQSPSGTNKIIDVIVGKYVGIGNQVGTTPNPFVGECAACHAGQLSWVADFTTPWLQTGHATAFSRLLDPTDPNHAASQAKGHWKDAFEFGSRASIDSRGVGFSTTAGAANGNWAQRAIEEGFVLQGATWSEMKRKFPKTAAMANVQCESCHGPGSEHAGDSANIRKSFDSNMCGRCHSDEHHLWEASRHGNPPISAPAGNASCNNCHTAQGFVVEMRAQEGADPHTALFAAGNINRPVIPSDERRGTTCQTCHDPHKRTAKRSATGSDPQLRAYGNVKFKNGATVNAGQAAVCFMCHNSRTDTTDGSADTNVRRAPHDSTAAEMLAGANGAQFGGWTYLNSPHGTPGRFVAPGQSENRQCLSCHKDAQPAANAPGHTALGGHSFGMKQGSGTVIASDSAHANGRTVAGTKLFRVDSGATFLHYAYPGDRLQIQNGSDVGTYTIVTVDTSRQISLDVAGVFTGGAATQWTITSVVKYNTAACSQCHTTGPGFQQVARGNYDGNAATTLVQDEIAGLIAAVTSAINAKLATLVGPGYTLTSSSGRIKYTNGATTRTFPGPSVTASDNPDILWASLSPAQQQQWTTLYKAAYNVYFVEHDKSSGIHNTGYAVNLLQASYYNVTGATIGDPFTPYP